MLGSILADTRSIEVRNVSYASVEYFWEFEKSRAGFYYLAEGRNPVPKQIFEGIAQVKKDLQIFVDSGACVDSFMQDQLIVYMMLAKLQNPSAVSTIATVKPTDHTTSAIHVSTLFADYRFSIQDKNDLYYISL